MQDLDTWLGENSAVYDKKTLMKIYQAATTPRFGCLYMNLMAHDPREMFYYKFEHIIVVQNSTTELTCIVALRVLEGVSSHRHRTRFTNLCKG